MQQLRFYSPQWLYSTCFGRQSHPSSGVRNCCILLDLFHYYKAWCSEPQILNCVTGFLRNVVKQCRMPEERGKENNDLRGSEKAYKGEFSTGARTWPVAIELSVWLSQVWLNVCNLLVEELSHPLLLLFSSFTYWYKAFVLSHSQQNTWFKIFVQVQASKTGGAVFFVPTGANCSEYSRNNMNQLHRPTICAQHYVGSWTNKRFTAPVRSIPT